MKRVVKILLLLLVAGMISVACSSHICPAYSDNSDATEQTDKG